ncbi:MAG: thioredoxin family protein [Sulfuriflexus sp.]|nr:thioredoxin family protein [Sulfuriflexus sp.]
MRLHQRLLASLVGLLLLLSSAHAAAVELTDLTDLQADAAQAQSQQLPILVMFSASYCGYCSTLKEEFLKPMLLSGDYTDKVIIRVLEIDDLDDIRDFDGTKIDPESFAERYNIYLTPTLAFIDPNGKELAPPLVGMTTIDFYGGYLDEAITNSLVQLRGGYQFSSAK